jgi:hypothetical protein
MSQVEKIAAACRRKAAMRALPTLQREMRA